MTERRQTTMKQRYEYQCVRLGGRAFKCTQMSIWKRLSYVFIDLPPWLTALDSHQQEINDHAKEGWRLVRVIPPSLWSWGPWRYYELIFEREIGQ
ncbi:MAG TPA: DUF4177 domain-containing protein [Verrucomicrobiae bacterium]|nr:DUF4177 domain-containing protein [Verrucomicrobiae bacterium]